VKRAYRRPTRPEAEAYLHLDAEAFGIDPDVWMPELDQGLLERIRIVEADGRVAAGLCIFDCGQWFGGRRLRCWAVGGVAVSPADRGTGAGRQVMMGLLRDARAEGVPLSALYASTPAFYRKCGYEPAGFKCAWAAPTHRLPAETTGAAVVPFEPDDDSIRDCYRAAAAEANGLLDRDDRLWAFKLKPHRGKRYGYKFVFDGRVEAYAVMGERQGDAITLADYAATSRRGRRAVLAFVHQYRSIHQQVTWLGGPHDPLTRLIPDNPARLKPGTEEWMLRITDVRAALTQRGYPTIDATLNLRITDDAIPENSGNFRLTLAQGEPSVETGGDGRLDIDIRGLTALFSAHLTAEEVAAVGLAEGSAEALACATRIFAGPAPYMVDQF